MYGGRDFPLLSHHATLKRVFHSLVRPLLFYAVNCVFVTVSQK